MESATTTIRVRKSTLRIIGDLKEHPRETAEDVLLRLIERQRKGQEATAAAE